MPDRSFHFIPGTRPDLFDRVGRLGADHYVLDLEDAVPHDSKDVARAGVADFVRSRPEAGCFVRLNPLDTAAGRADAAALAEIPGLGVMASKLEDAQDVAVLERALGPGPWRLVGLIESFAALERLPGILDRAGGRLVAMALGMEDLLTTTCFAEEDLVALTTHVRCRFAVACLARGVAAIDGICLETADAARIRDHALRGRAAGLAGQLTIHPAQVPIVNEIYGPPEAQVRWAERVLEAAGPEAATGYVRQGGLLVTPPKVKKALHIRNATRPDHA